MIDPVDLAYHYRLRRLHVGEPDDVALDQWVVTLERMQPSDDDAEVVEDEIGRARLYTLDIDFAKGAGQHPFDVADAHSADLDYYYEHLFDADGRPQEDFQDAVEAYVHSVLILHHVEMSPEHREQGLGRRLAAEAVLTLSRGAAAVIASPAPYGGLEDSDQRFRDITKATRFLAPLGFEPFRDGLWLLDPALEQPLSALRAVRYG